MSEQKIDPPKITKPIQLLAAWLAGLIIINGSFLATATAINTPTWAPSLLVVASVINVPVFLICLFLLQTKFRPEMQDDSYYARYLELNTGKVVTSSPVETLIRQLQTEVSENQQLNSHLMSSFESNLKLIAQIIDERVPNSMPIKEDILSIADEFERSTRSSDLVATQISVMVNDLIPEYHSIRREFNKRRIYVESTFGSTSQDPEVPKHKIISFGRDVPKSQLRDIVQICQKYGFNLINFSDGDIHDNRVYVGSYIYRAPEEPQPVSITDSIVEKLNSPDDDLYSVIEEIDSVRG